MPESSRSTNNRASQAAAPTDSGTGPKKRRPGNGLPAGQRDLSKVTLAADEKPGSRDITGEIDELEELLEERLQILRARRGEQERRKTA